MSYHQDDMAAEASFRMEVEEISNILAVMIHHETTIYRRSDYLANESRFGKILDGPWRQRIIEWMFSVTDHCALKRDCVAVASHYLDLCVDRGVVESRQQFQLVAMTALQLAIKLYDSTVVRLDSMIKLGRGLFTERDVINMEFKILSSLDWQVHPPTANCFLRQYLRLLPPSISPPVRYMLTEVTRFIAEITVCLYSFVDSQPSVVAYAALLIALGRIDEAAAPLWQREQINQIMYIATKLDYQGAVVQTATKNLHVALEKNISLRNLMKTIDDHCIAEGLSATYISDNRRATFNLKHQIPLGIHSPRDVAPTPTLHAN